MERKKFRIYIFEVLQIIFLLLACVYSQLLNKQIVAVVLLVFMVVTIMLLKNNKIKSIRSKQIVILMGLAGVIFVGLKYILGVFTGFYKAAVTLSMWSILNYIIPYIVIIVSIEIIRKRIVLSDTRGKIITKALLLVITVMIDIILFSNINSLNDLKSWFEFVVLILFPSIANNLLYNFIANNFKEEKGIIIYRIITTMYIYIISIIPDIEVLLEAIFNLSVPCILYIVLSKYLEKRKKFSLSKDRITSIITVISGVFAVMVVMLVSCKFKYCALVIGSGSMTGTINKGDVIIYEAYNEKMNIQKGDILIFKEKERKIVHRVIDKRIVKGKEVYYTKGDANQQEDEGYVTIDNVVGIYKVRVQYVGQVALGINKIFDKN